MSLAPEPSPNKSHESPPSIQGREIRARFQKACAIAHGCGKGLSANALMELVLEQGLPPSAERERILREKFASDEGTTLSPPPTDAVRCLVHNEQLEDANGYHGDCPGCN